MEKKFLITANEKLADIVKAKDIKEAIVDHAIENRLNPIEVEAEELGDMGIRELFVKTEVKKQLNKRYLYHEESDVTGATKQILDNDDFWVAFEEEIDGQIIVYMDPQE